RRGARALAVANIAFGLQHRLTGTIEPVSLLHRDPADRLADGVLDDADAQRLQLAVELTGDPPLPEQLRRRGLIVSEELGENRLRLPLRHRRRRCQCGDEQQCREAAALLAGDRSLRIRGYALVSSR